MKLSLQWIKQFTDITLDNDELVRRIGAQLGAIESVEDWSAFYSDQIIVAEITSAAAHPDADKLGLYDVKINDSEIRKLVAGDKTLQVGDTVGYIQPGAYVPLSVRDGEPFQISEREIRGQLSQGMLGSAKELLISDSHEGVLKLDTDAPVGTPFSEAYQLNDLIIDVENKMFTHRPDLFGILGLAREVAGIQGIKFSSPEWYIERPEVQPGSAIELPLSVENLAPDLCPRFNAVALSGVSVTPSSLMTQSMLFRVGLKSINTIVDSTNIEMYLTAQPSHAFDYDKVASRSGANGAALVVRKANKDEKIALLDGREITLGEEVVVVATDSEAISVAGCMGGRDTEVDETTTNIILEVASWDLYSIRRTSFAHGLFTDAVTRYSKGQSPRQTMTVLSHMLASLGGSIASEVHDSYPKASEPAPIQISAEFVNVRLGSSFSIDQISEILSNVEIQNSVADGELTVTVPFWRTDLECKEDLVEEVGRLHGYDNLPITLPSRLSSPNMRSQNLVLKNNIRNQLSQMGAKEVLTYNFVSSKLFAKAGYGSELIDGAYRIRNSISPELEYMRMSLLPSVIDKVNQNIRGGYEQFALFEVNKSHNKKEISDDGLPTERQSVAFVFASARAQESSSFYNAKSYLISLAAELGIELELSEVGEASSESPFLQSLGSLFANGRCARIISNGHQIGVIGEFNSATRRNFKLPENSAGFEFDIDAIQMIEAHYQQLSKFPSTTQDLTYDTPNDVTYGELHTELTQLLSNESYRLSLTPQSIYRSSPEVNRRLSFRATFVPLQKTLTTAEINSVVKNASETLAQKTIVQI